MGENILMDIQDLHVHFTTREGTSRALNGVNLKINRNETLGLVGESGCGKSMTARAILGIVPKPGRITDGKITFWPKVNKAVELTSLNPTGPQIRQIRGKEISMIFQEPMTSLSPVHTIGDQITEAIRLHQGLGLEACENLAAEMLSLVGIPDAKRRLRTYSFELSGGMRQRVMIAMALSCNPKLLIADEPTTALDVTIQAQILELMQDLKERLEMTIMIISHNLGVVASMAERVAVMYLGRVVEEGPTEEIFDNPLHPYTQGLLRSVPQVGVTRQSSLWTIKGSVPDPYSQVHGCTFHPRCHKFMKGICDRGFVPDIWMSDQHRVACTLYELN
ncbi:MAG: ABC transporter ATP-binding protein [Firmicutes bacterium]|nr:ABC transporter ATP-binding protein [Bacillota bacterium]